MNGNFGRKLILYTMFVALFALCSCGKDDDKLVMITTEKNPESTMQDSGTEAAEDGTHVTEAAETSENKSDDKQEEQSVDATEEAPATEEASQAEKNITLDDLYSANTGDRLLAGGNTGCSINTIYYSDGSEVYSEYKFIGFSESGLYMQAYEDSKGSVEVLDNYNQCWYVVVDNQISTMIYPEEGAAAYVISYEHNNMVLDDDYATNGEGIQDVYRQDGSLVVETRLIDEDSTQLTYRYILSDDYMVKEIYCYDQSGEKVSYSWVTMNAVYNTPDIIESFMNGEVDTRTLTIKYPAGDGMDNMFFVPSDYPVELDLLQYNAYSDEGCTAEWSDSAGGGDETIYLALP